MYAGVFGRYVGPSPSHHNYLTLNAAGIPCDDITAMGNQEMEAGETMRFHHLYSAERSYRKECIVFVECGPNYDGEQLADDMKETHAGSHCALDATDTGDYVNRSRSGITLLRDETVHALLSFNEAFCLRSPI